MKILKKPAGTLDILPVDAIKRKFLEDRIRKIFDLYNYAEVRTPSFEKTELFRRGIGDETDIVSKEMYSFKNDEFTLKPEMTAPVIRAYIENSLFNRSGIQKLYYIANMYRHERPQSGRYREFTQFGAEAIGSNDYSIDIEMIALSVKIIESLNIKNLSTKINTIGSPDERSRYLSELKNYLSKYINDLSEISKTRLEKNPLRILDTKIPAEIEILESAPLLYDFLNKQTKEHFSNVLSGLDGLDIKYSTDYRLVRGFDYYTSTTFEVISDDLGAQNAILGGGRYDNLVEQLGGKPAPAIGFACGLERLMIILEKNDFKYPDEENIKVYISPIGDKAVKESLKLLFRLREAGIKCDMDFLSRSLKAQLKEANKFGAEYVLIIGPEELERDIIKVKKMDESTESEIKLNDLTNKPNLLFQ
ncbi:MAG: histidine--tRNA ligase [Ignavibacteria bacterium]|nr:histidine--tRNA ligase [Ignavibacteria bacterium]